MEKSIKTAISDFEAKHLVTLNDLQVGLDKQSEISDALAEKIQLLGVETTKNINAIHKARVEIESASD